MANLAGSYPGQASDFQLQLGWYSSVFNTPIVVYLGPELI